MVGSRVGSTGRLTAYVYMQRKRNGNTTENNGQLTDLVQVFDTGLIGCDLSTQIREVLVQVARRVGVAEEELGDLLLKETPSVDHLPEDKMWVGGAGGRHSRGVVGGVEQFKSNSFF